MLLHQVTLIPSVCRRKPRASKQDGLRRVSGAPGPEARWPNTELELRQEVALGCYPQVQNAVQAIRA